MVSYFRSRHWWIIWQFTKLFWVYCEISELFQLSFKCYIYNFLHIFLAWMCFGSVTYKKKNILEEHIRRDRITTFTSWWQFCLCSYFILQFKKDKWHIHKSLWKKGLKVSKIYISLVCTACFQRVCTAIQYYKKVTLYFKIL